MMRRQILTFALIAILVVVPVMAVLAIVPGLTADATTVRFDGGKPFVAQSVALRALTLLRAPPV